MKRQFEFKNAETDNLESKIKNIYSFECAPIDIILGGGIIGGKIYEIYGRESSGKTTFAIEAVKSFINYCKIKNKNCQVLWIESEYSLDLIRAKYIGVDISKLKIFETQTTEEGFEASYQFLNTCLEQNIKPMIIWDTIAATQPLNIIESGEIYAGGMAQKPRVIYNGLKMITQKLSEMDCPFLILNQVIAELNSPVSGAETTPGGRGIKFHASTRIKMKGTKLKKKNEFGEEQVLGLISTLYTEKNKLTLPQQTVQIIIHGELGINKLETNINFLKQYKLIKQSGSWYTFENLPPEIISKEITEIKFQSIDKLINDYIIKNPKLDIYINFLIYKQFAITSSLLKIRLINKIWEYELQLFNKKITELTDKEKELIKNDLEQTKVRNNTSK